MGAGDLVLVAEQQPALELAADAAQRGRREHAFRRAARAHVDVDGRFGIGDGDDAVAVVGRGSPSATQRLGSDCDWRFT